MPSRFFPWRSSYSSSSFDWIRFHLATSDADRGSLVPERLMSFPQRTWEWERERERERVWVYRDTLAYFFSLSFPRKRERFGTQKITRGWFRGEKLVQKWSLFLYEKTLLEMILRCIVKDALKDHHRPKKEQNRARRRRRIAQEQIC